MKPLLEDFSLKPQYQRFGSCEIEIAQPFCLVIFGAAGDLTRRKLLPAIYHLYTDGLLPKNFFIYGTDIVKMSQNKYRDTIKDALKVARQADLDNSSWTNFSKKMYYTPLDFTVPKSFIDPFKKKLPSLEKKHNTGTNRILYMAIPPTIVEHVINNIGTIGLSIEEKGFIHIVIEKPFGHDLDTAKILNNTLKKYFTEKQIFRIDHYVAKETVQNMLMFRFANSIFEPLWNRRYIDHIQILASETIGVEHRAGYYEKAGVIRDMFQSHIFQLLAVTAMEPPVIFQADRVRDEKIKVFRSIRPFPLDTPNDYVAIGQYGKGKINGKSVIAYREEPGVSPESITATFAAMKIFIDNWRWNGVPFYLRSGKRLPVRKTEISIHFKPVPHMMFSKVIEEDIKPNVLVFRLQPNEGINLEFQTKRQGTKVCLDPVLMDFTYQKEVFHDAYEWVLLDCILGDQMLFLRQEGVEETWAILTPIIEKLESIMEKDIFPNYPSGSSGPNEADQLIEKDSRLWRPLESLRSGKRLELHRFKSKITKSYTPLSYVNCYEKK